MPTETALHPADEGRRDLDSTPDRPNRTGQLVGVATLAGVIALTAAAVPWLLTPDGNRSPGSTSFVATSSPTAPAQSPSASGVPTSAAPTTPPTGAAAAPEPPGSRPPSTPDQSGTRVAPAPTPPVAPSPAAASPDSSPPAPSFSPVSVEAEDPGNLLSDGAAVVACGTCDGGARVRYVGRVTAYLTTATAGRRTITVRYEVDGERGLQISINGAAPTSHRVSGTGWGTPQTLRYTATVPAGRISMAFYNDAGPAPDIDKITIS
ncbi:hypothetical protein HCA58_02080 [Micromonospora sp. HNM0581]|uniref:hypothetical protein n=1 Tax=Micromonospora sp. HNM0581 TaxID=2716341 RepID=UPI00146E7C39|nr:hypothetical protein [Micromonospora sp. HNM0581]NLU77199.1 hypothetical protein [Micromonospora sp. HNM0581]